MRMGLVFAGLLILSPLLAPGAFARDPLPVTNTWIKASSGNWGEPSAWSAGAVPTRTHWVQITNDVDAIIEINSDTARNFPQSLTVFNLSTTNRNTLLLNQIGAPFQMDAGTNYFAGLTIGRASKILNFGSEMIIGPRSYLIGGELAQDGGSLQTPDLGIYSGGVFRLTNGTVSAGYIDFNGGTVHQYGGSVVVTNWARVADMSQYFLHGGEISIPTNTLMVGNTSTFTQEAGIIRVAQVAVGPGESGGHYFLDDGELYAGAVSVTAFRGESSFEQETGLVVITNALELMGSAYHYPWNGVPAVYRVGTSATLRAKSLQLEQGWGVCDFESAGLASFSGDIQVTGDPDFKGRFVISDGVVSCANLLDNGAVVDILQTGGGLTVANLFSFTGYYPGAYGINNRPARYDFQAGTLSADRIELGAEWIIGSSSRAHRIYNPGQIAMAGIIRAGDSVEQFGRFRLIDDSTIDLGPGDAKLSFAASNSEQWEASATLTILNWAGSGLGGANDELKFGVNRSGLTAAQLTQIRFVNPIGYPSGEYAAQILDTGEVVPLAPPQLSVAMNGASLVIDWPNNSVLQSAENVEGPYTDIPSATRPYAADLQANSKLFLRLKP